MEKKHYIQEMLSRRKQGQHLVVLDLWGKKGSEKMPQGTEFVK